MTVTLPAPDTMADGKKEYESTTIPVKLEQTSNRNKDFYIYLTQRYRLDSSGEY